MDRKSVILFASLVCFTLVGGSALACDFPGVREVTDADNAALCQVADLKRQGSRRFRARQFQLAINSYQRAQQILHASAGVNTLDQLELVDWMSISYLLLGDPESANVQQEFYYRLNSLAYGEASSRMLPAINRLADWYYVSGQLSKARKCHEAALGIIARFGLNGIEATKSIRGLNAVRLQEEEWWRLADLTDMTMRFYYIIEQQMFVDDIANLARVNGEYAHWLASNGELIAALEIIDPQS